MLQAAVWYNGKIVYDEQNTPSYVGGCFKRIKVDESIGAVGFLLFVREQCGISSDTAIRIYYRLYLSSTISTLVNIEGCEKMADIMQDDMIHPFYVEFISMIAEPSIDRYMSTLLYYIVQLNDIYSFTS